MMNSLRLVTRQNVHHLRQFHKCRILSKADAAPAAATIESLTTPVPLGVDKPVSPKIDKIVNDITALTLLEVAELNDTLKKRLNLPDAPVMPMGGFFAPKQEEQEEEVQQVQTSFSVKLLKFDDTKKVALIKMVKSLLPDMNLVQAKKFIESAPVIIKSDLSKEEAEQLKGSIIDVGGEVEIA